MVTVYCRRPLMEEKKGSLELFYSGKTFEAIFTPKMQATNSHCMEGDCLKERG